MVCWWVHCGWPGFQVEDDPKNVQKCRKMLGKCAVSFPLEINLCALKEPNKYHCLPALPTKVDYIRIPRCVFWLKRTLRWPPRYVKQNFSVYLQGRLLSSEIYLTQKQMLRRFKKQNACSSVRFIFWNASPRLTLTRLASPLSFIFSLLCFDFFFCFYFLNKLE